MKNLAYLLLLSLIFLFGCDCYIQQKGRVLSNVDGLPIVNAQVKLSNTSKVVLTDSSGYYNLEYIGGGNCLKLAYIITKEGYKDFGIEFNYSDSERIFKVKKGDKKFDLKGKLFYPDSSNLSTYFGDIQFDKYSKDFKIKDDSLILFMDPDDPDIDFSNYLKDLRDRGWNIDKYKIK